MKLSNYIQVWVLTLVLMMCVCAPLLGQSALSHEFILEAHKSVKNIERFQATRSAIFKTYLTFHPVSISNDTMSMYLSSVFTDNDGKTIIESGRIVRIPARLLPDEPLQLLVLPLVMYLNNMEAYRTNINFRNRFSEKELNIWKVSGYKVQDPYKIRTAMQYR